MTEPTENTATPDDEEPGVLPDPDADDAQNDPEDDLAPADDDGEGQEFSEPADGVQDDGV